MLHMTLTLALFETRIFLVNDIQLALSTHDFTINTAFFYGCPDFHTVIIIFFFALYFVP